MIKNIFKNEDGYTLLFAVLVSSIVLSVGISILTISKKEFLLASSARESMSALYAADSGLECAMYQDSIGNLATSSTFGTFTCGNNIGFSLPTYTCDTSNGMESCILVSPLQLSFGSGKACAVVDIKKTYGNDPNLGYDIQHTQIESRGYNMGWNSNSQTCDDISPKKVERALRMTY